MGTAVLSREEECRSVSICPPTGHTPGFFRAGEPEKPLWNGSLHARAGAAATVVSSAVFRGLDREESESELQGEQVPLRRRLLNGWMAVAGRFGSIQTLLLLVFFYLVLIGPISVLQALGRRDQLDKRALWKKESAWHQSESGGTDLERAKLLS